MKPKRPADSAVETTQIVLPTHTNRFGTIFGGQIMAWIDITGGVAAMRHASRLVVTASMDQLHFLHGARTGDVVVLRAQVNYAGSTSMEVGVRVDSEDPVTGERRHTATAYLTFVAVDRDGRPASVPPVLVESEDDQRRYRKAELRRAERLRVREAVVERAHEKEQASDHES